MLSPPPILCSLQLVVECRDSFHYPSESLDRMVAKLLAFSINAQAGLAFTKGLSAVEEELNKLLAGLGQKIVKM